MLVAFTCGRFFDADRFAWATIARRTVFFAGRALVTFTPATPLDGEAATAAAGEAV